MKYNLAQYFSETCRNHPEKVALATEEREYTYEQIWNSAVAVSHFLKSRGVKSGERVLLVKETGHSMIISFWGALLCGATVAIYSHKNSIDKILFTLENAEPKFLIVDDSLLESLLSDLQTKNISYTAAGALGEISAAVAPATRDFSSIISEDIAMIIYTSGSTGAPKGVTLTHGNMTAAMLSITTYLSMKSTDVIVSALPLTFDYGLYQMIMTFCLGATLILEENSIWSPGLLKKVEKYKGTILPIVPTMVVAFDAFKATLKLDLSSVRIVTNTAERFQEGNFQTIAQLFPSAQMFSMYGLTECKRCTYVPPDRLAEKSGSVGKAIPNTEIRIIDEKGAFLPAHEEGELVIRGTTVMRGYWKMPEATARSFHYDDLGNRWLRSGDYGYLDPEGFFYLKGRRDAIVKVRGTKVSLIEVEDVLASSDLVHEAGIVVEISENRPARLIAYVSPAKECTTKDILRYSREHLQPSEVPAEIRMVGSLPKNLNGKIDRKALGQLASLKVSA
jgi:acyl-CoA synthetase (AMP-forming)/AMP-acid ligase II